MVVNLGSIRLTGYGQLNTKEFILNYEDVDKLNLLSDAGEGSTAFCVDTGQLYIKHEGIWKEVKKNEQSGTL